MGGFERHDATVMKFEPLGSERKYDRGRPETTITSWAASILVFCWLGALAISPTLQKSHSSWQSCTVVIDCVKEPIILHTNSVAHRVFVLALKNELKFFGNLLRRFA
jgi:hypothetical protein